MAQRKLIAYNETLKRMEIPNTDTYLADRNLEVDGNFTVTGTVNGFNLSATLPKLDYLTVTGAINLDTIKTKTDFITVTQAVDLDQMEADIAGLSTAVVLKGTWDFSSNLYPISTKAGESWIVSVAGNGAGVPFAINDRVVALIDGASQANATHWHKLDYTDEVLSVAGRTGTITLLEADISDLQSYLTSLDLDSLAKLNALVGDSLLSATAIDTLAKLNSIITDATLIDTADPRLSDTRTPIAHYHTEFPLVDTLTAYAGGGQANALQLTAGANVLRTVTTLGDSVKLPVAAPGKQVLVTNEGATIAYLYPYVGNSIAHLALNAFVPIPPNGNISLQAIDTINWKVL